ncbi:hypothetical protein RSOL_070440 [Rhizoctonia solani AG-3 Rhs1AP]|uniref:Uncharacterized protein n=2 Tax=Rhizoctonia solani AG-3 TaxID=1086053 RepID=A0A074SE95_9AGAM|nr:hypothetical protein RSOL_070440 [Rhizoctonia solani AG-3 Rhs1AP]KEP48317.1 hypothetical protein V565_127890 [Rhizoctonia solani 123E]
MANGTLSAQEKAAVDRILDISVKIRKAIQNSIPTPLEQVMTIMVPGKVVNLEDYTVQPESIDVPPMTQLKQAILCDDMPPMSTIQTGPTGRSVAASYERVISKLVASSVALMSEQGVETKEGRKRYKDAVAKLREAVQDSNGKLVPLIDLYTQKQSVYVAASEKATEAVQKELQAVRDRNLPVKEAQESYFSWIQVHVSALRSNVQAAYTDWCINGRKDEVEYWFSLVDHGSALAQVEKSKDGMRNSVILDTSGWEYNKVTLEPSNWANQCLEKMKIGSSQKSPEWYAWEIKRLRATNSMLKALRADPAVATPETPTDLKPLDDAIKAAEKELQEKEGAAKKDDAEINKLKGKVQEAKNSYSSAKQRNDTLTVRNNQREVLGKAVKDNQFVQSEIDNNESRIQEYEKAQAGSQTIQYAALKVYAEGNKEFKDLASYLVPRPNSKDPKPGVVADFFTSISVEVSASSDKVDASTSALSASLGVAAGKGPWSVAVSADHSQSHSKAMSELAQCSVKISFDCMRVDINRSWLRPELFNDSELTVSEGIAISPGYDKLRQLIYEAKALDGSSSLAGDLAKYALFPFYPVAFLVACNVVLEITGTTTSLETYMNSSSTAVAASVNYGCFSLNASGSYASTNSGSNCQKTDTGCRIEIKAPQIIGWISQLVPELPRPGAAAPKS